MNNTEEKIRIWRICFQKGAMLIDKGLEFYEKGQLKDTKQIPILKEEYAIGSRYLHRGYYCPSKVKHIIVDNARKGKIISRVTTGSKITHKYLFDTEGRLIIAVSILPDKKRKYEYLVYEDNSIFGFAFDEWDALVGVSEEKYDQDEIISYFCASCYIHKADKIDMGITNIHYEEYKATNEEQCEVKYYFTNFWIDSIEQPEDADATIHGGYYRVNLIDQKIL